MRGESSLYLSFLHLFFFFLFFFTCFLSFFFLFLSQLGKERETAALPQSTEWKYSHIWALVIASSKDVSVTVTINTDLVVNINEEFFSLAQVICISAVIFFSHINTHTLLVNLVYSVKLWLRITSQTLHISWQINMGQPHQRATSLSNFNYPQLHWNSGSCWPCLVRKALILESMCRHSSAKSSRAAKAVLSTLLKAPSWLFLMVCVGEMGPKGIF